MLLVVTAAVLVSHHVDDSVGEAKENELHYCVIERVEVPEDVNVTRCEYNGIEFLTLKGDTLIALLAYVLMY